MDTTELVIQAQSGSDQAMEQLFTVWRPRLVRRAQSLVRNAATAQDVVQETLVRAFRNLDSLANPAAFASWVYVILRRVGIELAVRESRERNNTVSFEEEWLTPGAVESFELTHDRLELAQCLSRLRLEDRDLLELHYWGGQELGEIAPRFGIATGAAKTRLFRARGRIGALLSEA